MKYILSIAILLPFVLHAATYEARVIRVVDGDTVILHWEGQQSSVRIIGIDTPEIDGPHTNDECWGVEASEHARSLLPKHSRVSFVFSEEYDKYNRALGYITLPDERDFGAAMIEDGHAYAYRVFSHSRMSSYINLEKEARTNARGLWADDACYTSPQSTQQIQDYWQQQLDYLIEILKLLFAQLA